MSFMAHGFSNRIADEGGTCVEDGRG
uniref:Uncharacterized protein n=1 Tax=Arundo donax TaxID=35708 RepID=A0A0A9AB13_ARUDO